VLRRTLGSLSIGLCVLSGLVACSGDDDDTARISQDMDDAIPPPDDASDDVLDVQYDTFDGGATSLAAYAGEAVVVNFFASTCVPCVVEMPEFEGVHQAVGDDVTFVGIAVDDTAGDAADLVERTGVTYDTGLDPDSRLFQAMGGVALPTTALVRADGTIAEVRTGQVSEGKLRDLLEEFFGVT
jgi:cytochrome c biogenesis protein CcmG, thiol:disulfide interchange protein DsbE